MVWLLIQAIWSGEVSSVSIIVIGLVQVWSGFQTISTLSPNRTKLKRGDVYLNFSPYSSSCPIPVAPQAHTLEDTYERQRRARDAGRRSVLSGPAATASWLCADACGSSTSTVLPGRRRRPSRCVAGARGHQGARPAPAARWPRRTAPWTRRT